MFNGNAATVQNMRSKTSAKHRTLLLWQRKGKKKKKILQMLE